MSIKHAHQQTPAAMSGIDTQQRNQPGAEDRRNVADIACLGFDKSIILSYNPYKLVIPIDRGQCPDASIG